jgi:hypothetical protein
MKCPSALVSTITALALVSVPLSSASAHGRHRDGGLLFGLAALGAAVVVGVATVATAPIRALAAVPAPAPAYAPPAYAYAPAPVYAPPAYAYAPPPVYARPPVYYAAPPGYVYVR